MHSLQAIAVSQVVCLRGVRDALYLTLLLQYGDYLS